jgi:hypothetical protein
MAGRSGFEDGHFPARPARPKKGGRVSKLSGLGFSLTIYLLALAGGLLLFAGPVYLSNGATHLSNPGLAAYDPPPGALLIPEPSAQKELPLAVLKRREIVDPAIAAMVNARTKQTAQAEPARRTSRSEPVYSRDEPPTTATIRPRPAFTHGNSVY